jgi:hypothetical protein
MISGWEKILNLRAVEQLIFPEMGVPSGEDGSRHERLAIPYLFQPALSLSEAVVATLRAFVRIFLGSLLFGVWGAYAMLLWTSIPNPFLRVAAMILMITVFLVLLGGLLIATTLLLRPRARQFTQL